MPLHALDEKKQIVSLKDPTECAQFEDAPSAQESIVLILASAVLCGRKELPTSESAAMLLGH